MNLKLLSWNVNGIRAVQRKGLEDWIQKASPDILCVQETKANPTQVELKLPGYGQHFWNSSEKKKGYSGTAIFSKIEPKAALYDLGKKEYDQEGRVITLEFDQFYLVNVYTPNAQDGLKRIDFRMQWDKDFLKHILKLEKKKPVIFCGDLNVAHQEIDLARPKQNEGKKGFSEQERSGFQKYIDKGYLDSFRLFNDQGENYTWWTHWGGARERNVGWRIDYWMVSGKLKSKIKNATILPDVMGSDHCPVGLEMEISV